MAEHDMYVAAFNDVFRGEFIKCVDVLDIIVALGKTLTITDEENVRAVYKTEGNTSAAICLCERLCRKPNWKENIVKALRSDDIGQGDLADRIEEKFKEVKAVNKTSVNRLDDETYTSFYNRLKENIKLSNMYIRKDVRGDGNCFLYCIQDQFERLGLPNRSSMQLRADLVNYLQNLDEEDPLISLIDDNYLNNLSKDGTYVDEIAVRGMSRILNHDFYIVTSQRRSTEQGFLGTKIHESLNPEGLMLFGQIGEVHYISLGITNSLPFHQTSGDVSNSNQNLIPQSPQSMVNINVNVYNGARPKETSQVVIDKSSTSDSAVFGIRPTTSVSNAVPETLTLDSMCISMVTEEARIKELYSQVLPQVTQISVAARRQDDPFGSVITGMMLDIEQKLELNVEPLQRHSENYGYRIAELSKQEKNQKKDDEEESGRVVLFKHLAVYNKVLQMNEIMRTKDAFALLKKLYKEHDEDDEWLDDLYQEHSSQLYKLSKEGDSKYENPRLARLKREILKKSDGDFKAIIISEHRHVREALHDWLSSSPDFKNIKTHSLSTTDKSSEIKSFNSGNQRLLLASSDELKGAKLLGVRMAVIFVSVIDGIRICQSDDEDVTQELLGLVAQLQFTDVVKRLQDIPAESVKRKNSLEKKLQILRESEVLEEQSISPKKNLSESMRVEEMGNVKGVSGRRYSLDTNVRGQTSEGEHDFSEPVKSPLASSLTKSKVVRVKEKDVPVKSLPSLDNQIGEANEGWSYTIDRNVSSQCKNDLSKFKLYCRGATGDGKCTTDAGMFVCSLSDTRLMSQSNHVYKKKYWNWSKINVKDHHDKMKKKFGMKKIYCKKCGADWGNTFKLYPCLKLNNFNVKFPNGELKYFPQWGKLGVSIPPME